MIDIKDVKCKNCIQTGNTVVTATEDLKADWKHMIEEERQNWYTTKEVRAKLDVKDILEHEFENLEDEGYEDMAEKLWSDVTDEQLERLQNVLDDIMSSPAAVVFYEHVKINPDSEVRK